MKILLTIVAMLFSIYSYSQYHKGNSPCPDNLGSGNQNDNPVTLYVYNSDDLIIGSVTCNRAGNSNNINCDLSNLPTEASFLSFGACLYDINGVKLEIGVLPIELLSFTSPYILIDHQ